jgi:uncharacterized protein YbjT (DUF2867 family)
MEKKNVAIIGGTGLIGNQLLSLLLKVNHFADIYLISRRKFIVENARVKNIVIDFNDD